MVRLLDDVDHIPAGFRFVATVGVFDGVHLGHLHVLQALAALAVECGAVPIAITFEPHPQAVVTGRTPALICDPVEKLARMGEAGAEIVVVQRFDEAFRSQTAEEFLDRLGQGRELAGLVMSHESAFGRDRQGTVETVRRLAAAEGWRLVEVDTLELDGDRISSGRVRELVAAGELGAAERLLGRRYAVSGVPVAMGHGSWRVDPAAPFAMPPTGSYAIKASWEHDPEPGAAAGLEVEDADRQAGSVDATRPLDGDPLNPSTMELGLGRIDALGVLRLAFRDGVDGPGVEPVRVQLVESLEATVVTATDARLEAVLATSREGIIGVMSEPGAGGAAYRGWWMLIDEPAGLDQVDTPVWDDLADALTWARARSRRVVLSAPDGRLPVDPGASPSGTEWSAGDEHIEGLPAWPARTLDAD